MGTPIKTYVCQTKCFYQNRVWTPGEKLQLNEGDKVPAHFVEKAKFKPDPKAVVPNDPKTLSEFTKQEQERAREAVGHGKPKQPVIAGMPAAETQQAPAQTEDDPFK